MQSSKLSEETPHRFTLCYCICEICERISWTISNEYVFFLSQDDKARVPMGLPLSKKEDVMLCII